MKNFTCGNHSYRAGKLDARSQFHIVRRLAPFLSGMLPLLAEIGSAEEVKKMDKEQFIQAMPKIIPGFMDILSRMDDETADYIIFGLLSCVARQEDQGLGYAPVVAGRSLMYQDIDMAQMITIAARALMANLGDFFGVLNSVLKSQGQNQNAQ